MIRLAEPDDLENIISLWKANRSALGIPWRKNILNLINKKSFYVLDDESIIGMCAYQIMPVKKEIWVVALAVDYRFRRKGYGTELLNHTINHIPETDREKYPLYLSYVVGDENNDFYQQFNWDFVCNNYFKNIVTEVYEIPFSRKEEGGLF